MVHMFSLYLMEEIKYVSSLWEHMELSSPMKEPSVIHFTNMQTLLKVLENHPSGSSLPF